MSEKDLLITVPGTEGQPDGLGVYNRRDIVSIIAYSQQYSDILYIDRDIALGLGEALVKQFTVEDEPWYSGIHVYRSRIVNHQEVDTVHYLDASIYYSSSDKYACLSVALKEDAETGTLYDVDGDRAKDGFRMYNPVISVDGPVFVLKGFVKVNDEWVHECWVQRSDKFEEENDEY